MMETNGRSTSPPPRQKIPAENWRGAVNVIDVTQISITAHEVSGDCSDLGCETTQQHHSVPEDVLPSTYTTTKRSVNTSGT
ncbi:unnamed protein product [Phaedon cochleariae]|uniref:Uncharacterized protein n=1 Tax=Phaedon cochleariae TaxID=80249 RepID=A0A9N9X479_PHACE|nr:unnamed protein product [Phaedon cochleariae]